jgi:hypothetical protein
MSIPKQLPPAPPIYEQCKQETLLNWLNSNCDPKNNLVESELSFYCESPDDLLSGLQNRDARNTLASLTSVSLSGDSGSSGTTSTTTT